MSPYFDYDDYHQPYSRHDPYPEDDFEDDFDVEMDWTTGRRLRRWDETLYVRLEAHFGGVSAGLSKECDESRLERFAPEDSLDDVLRRIVKWEREELRIESPNYMQRVRAEGRDPWWQQIGGKPWLGKIMEGFARRLVKVQYRTPTTKRVLRELMIDETEPDYPDAVDEDHYPVTDAELDETCDAFCFEFVAEAAGDPLGLGLLRVRLRWGPDWHDQDYTRMTDEYMAFKLHRSLADVLRLMTAMLGVQYGCSEHAVRIRDHLETDLLPYHRLDDWFTLGWQKAFLTVHISPSTAMGESQDGVLRVFCRLTKCKSVDGEAYDPDTKLGHAMGDVSLTGRAA